MAKAIINTARNQGKISKYIYGQFAEHLGRCIYEGLYVDENSDILITLPGGFGTLEEVLEVITSKQLGYHSKPIVIFNYCGYYDNLLAQFEESYSQNFAKRVFSLIYYVTDDIDDMFDYIDNYKQEAVEDKWS